MTGATERAEAAYDALIEAMLAIEDDRIKAATAELLVCLQGLGADAQEHAIDMALDLDDGWDRAEEIAQGDPDAAAWLRSTISEVMVELGDAYPHPIFAFAYDAVGLALLEREPERAVQRIDRAVELAESDAERAGYLVSLAFAVHATGDAARALVIAEAAGRPVGQDDATRSAADGLILELLNEAGSPEAWQRALGLLADSERVISADLGQTIVRVLIVEAGRQEDCDEPVSRQISDGLRTTLAHPDWSPDPLTPSDMAVLVAWSEFTRDEVSRLEETLVAAAGPFCDADVEAQAALLWVVVHFDNGDIVRMEAALRAAAPAVAASGAPHLVTVYRVVAEMFAKARGGQSLAEPAEFERLRASQGKEVPLGAQLFLDCLDAMQVVFEGQSAVVPGELRSRLDAWCTSPSSTDPLVDGVLWVTAAASAMADGDLVASAERLRALERARSALSPEAPQQKWFDVLLDAVRPAFDQHRASTASLAEHRTAAEGHRRAGNLLASSVLDGQLALIANGRDPQQALAAAVRALDDRRSHLAALPGSSERVGLREFLQKLTRIAMQSAAVIGDPFLMAELLEYLRAQDMPVVDEDPDPTRLPLAMLLPPAAFGDRPLVPDLAVESDAVGLGVARPVLMPWGTVALAGILPQPTDGSARLTIPR